MAHFVIPQFHLVGKHTQYILAPEQYKYFVINKMTSAYFKVVKFKSVYAVFIPILNVKFKTGKQQKSLTFFVLSFLVQNED